MSYTWRWRGRADGIDPNWTQVTSAKASRSHVLFRRTQTAMDHRSLPLNDGCSLSSDILAQFNLSHLLKKDSWDSQCPTALPFYSIQSSSGYHFLNPASKTPSANSLPIKCPTCLSLTDTLPRFRGCVLLGAGMLSQPGFSPREFSASFRLLCADDLNDWRPRGGWLGVFCRARESWDVFLWLAQVYCSMLFFFKHFIRVWVL